MILGLAHATLNTFLDSVREELEVEEYAPALALGKAGIGKTVGIKQLADEMGIGYKELRLVMMDPTDITGLPDIKEVYQKNADGELVRDCNGNFIPARDEHGNIKKVTTYDANELMPQVERDGERGILVIDEITSATRDARAAIFGLCDSTRKAGSYILPPKWKVVMLGNGEEDGGVYQGLERALVDRCVTKFNVDASVDEWKKWASSHGVNPSVIAFIAFDGANLYPELTAEALESDLAITPTPRSWTALSTKLTKMEELNRKKSGNPGVFLDRNKVLLYALGCVGDGTGNVGGTNYGQAFAEFYSYNNSLLSIEDIFSGKIDSGAASRVGREVIYLTIEALNSELNRKLEAGYDREKREFNPEVVKEASNMTNWFIDLEKSIGLDYTITGLTGIVQKSELFKKLIMMSEFDEACPKLIPFIQAHNKIIQ